MPPLRSNIIKEFKKEIRDGNHKFTDTMAFKELLKKGLIGHLHKKTIEQKEFRLNK